MHLASFKVHQVDSVFQSFRAGEKGYYVTVCLSVCLSVYLSIPFNHIKEQNIYALEIGI